MIRLLTILAIAAALSGCATIQRNIRQSLVDRCTQAGFYPSHPQHEECITNTAALDRQQAQQDAIAAFTIGAAAGAYSNANPVVPVQPVGQEYWLTRQWSAEGRTFCQYSDGTLQILNFPPCPPSVRR